MTNNVLLIVEFRQVNTKCGLGKKIQFFYCGQKKESIYLRKSQFDTSMDFDLLHSI